MSCRPKGRKSYQVLTDNYAEDLKGPDLTVERDNTVEFNCAIDYLTDYVIYKEEKSGDRYMLDHLFNKTREMAYVARENHLRSHSFDVKRGAIIFPIIKDRAYIEPDIDPSQPEDTQRVLREELRDSCDVKKDLENEKKLAKCRLERFYSHRITSGPDIAHTFTCSDSDYGPLDKCPSLGCSQETVSALKDAEDAINDGFQPCWALTPDEFSALPPSKKKYVSLHNRAQLTPDEALHYDLDQTLEKISKMRDDAPDVDKVWAIEKFAHSHHHGGSVFDFACHEPETNARTRIIMDLIVLDILDCLHGTDFEL